MYVPSLLVELLRVEVPLLYVPSLLVEVERTLLRSVPEVLLRVLLGRVYVSRRFEVFVVLFPTLVRVLLSLVPTTRPLVVLSEEVRTDDREDW